MMLLTPIPNHEVTFFLLLVNESHMGLWRSNLFLQCDGQVSVDCEIRTVASNPGSSRLLAYFFSCERGIEIPMSRLFWERSSQRKAYGQTRRELVQEHSSVFPTWVSLVTLPTVSWCWAYSFSTRGLQQQTGQTEDSQGSSKCLDCLEAFSQTLEILTGVIWTLGWLALTGDWTESRITYVINHMGMHVRGAI